MKYLLEGSNSKREASLLSAYGVSQEQLVGNRVSDGSGGLGKSPRLHTYGSCEGSSSMPT